MAKKPFPTPEELRQLLEYDPHTGVLTWKPRVPSMFAPGNRGSDTVCSVWNMKYAGREAGTVCPRNGYRIIGLGRLVGSHRIAWAIHYGKWPDAYIDHINGDKLDNRIENLRDVSMVENQRNATRRVDNKTGATGVYQGPRGVGWVAKIRVEGKQVHLGTFRTFEAAALARLQANREYGFSERHGT